MVETISQRVCRAINGCGHSRYSIGNQSGVSEGMLSRFISNQVSMSPRTLDRIASIIGIELAVNNP